MALYTGKGDGGTTKLFDTKSGERVSKHSIMFDALGTLDELNTFVGWCRAGCAVDWRIGDSMMSALLLDVQNRLFTAQAELAGADKTIPLADVKDIETTIAIIEGELPEITTFLVPGGTELSARLDIARTVARRAERLLVGVHEGERKLSPHTLAYMNRLSSLLYALVRFVNERHEAIERPPEYAG